MQDGVRPQRREHVALTGDDAEGGVVVAADPLRRRVQHEVDAVADRLLAERRGERRVDERERAGDRPQLVEVDEVEPWVGRRLGDHEHRLAGHDGRGEGPRLGAVDPGHVDAHPRARAEQEGARAGVDLACRRRCGRRSSTARTRRTRRPPCRTRRRGRPRRPPTRRSPPRRRAPSGWRSGCRSCRHGWPWPACECRRARPSATRWWPTAGA